MFSIKNKFLDVGGSGLNYCIKINVEKQIFFCIFFSIKWVSYYCFFFFLWKDKFRVVRTRLSKNVLGFMTYTHVRDAL